MAESLWSVRLPSGQQLDNQSTADLKALVASGQLGPEDMVFREGLDDWVKARKLKGLFPATQQVVPPAAPPRPELAKPQPNQHVNQSSPTVVNEKKSSGCIVQCVVGFLIFLVVFMVLDFVTDLHFVLGVFAGLMVIGGVGVATFVILFKPDLLPDHLRPKLGLAKSPLIAIALAGLFGTMAAIAVPRLEREAAEDATKRIALIDEAEQAYEEGRVEDALRLAEEALYTGNSFDDDPNREVARRLQEKFEQELEQQRIKDVRTQRTDLIAQAEDAYEGGRLEDALDLATAAYEAGEKSDDDPEKGIAERLQKRIERELISQSQEQAITGLGVSVNEVKNKFPLLKDNEPTLILKENSESREWYFGDDLKAVMKGDDLHSQTLVLNGPQDDVLIAMGAFLLPVSSNDRTEEGSQFSMMLIGSLFAHTTNIKLEDWGTILTEMLVQLSNDLNKGQAKPVIRLRDEYMIQMYASSEDGDPWITIAVMREPKSQN